MFKIQKPEHVNKTFRLPLHLVQQLEQIAQDQEISVNQLVIQCIKVTHPHFKWGFDFSPSRAFCWFRQRRGFVVPFVLSAFYKGISTSFHPLTCHFLLVLLYIV